MKKQILIIFAILASTAIYSQTITLDTNWYEVGDTAMVTYQNGTSNFSIRTYSCIDSISLSTYFYNWQCINGDSTIFFGAANPAWGCYFIQMFDDNSSLPVSNRIYYNVVNPSSIENKYLNQKLKLYPNPTNIEYVNINVKDSYVGQIILTNILGEKVLNEYFYSKKVILNLSDIKYKGVYFVEIIDIHGNPLATKRLIYN